MDYYPNSFLGTNVDSGNLTHDPISEFHYTALEHFGKAISLNQPKRGKMLKL